MFAFHFIIESSKIFSSLFIIPSTSVTLKNLSVVKWTICANILIENLLIKERGGEKVYISVAL